MKKQFYLLILLIAVFFTTRAQTTVVNQLQIKTVPTDTTATDVLVRGADRKVKKVPISFLQSTPLPTPSLQEVLDRNQYASGRLIGLSFGTYGTPFYENLYMGAPYGFYNTKGVYGTDSYRRVELSTDNGLYLKTSSLGNGFLKFKADNLENNNVVLQSPKLSGIIPISVNGNYADQDGNITIASTSSVPTLQEVLNAGNNAVSNLKIDNYNGLNSILLSNNTYIQISDNVKQEYFDLTPNSFAFSTYNASTTNANYVGNWGWGVTGLKFAGRIREGGGSNPSVESNFNYPLINTSISATLPISVNGNYADTSGNINLPTIASSGKYTPTFEIISNLSNVTAGGSSSYYTKVGNVVTVYIRFFNNQSAANTATAFRASLPFPRANTTQINYVGTGTVGYGGVESDIPCRVFFEPGQTSCRISYYTKGNFGTQFGVVSLQYSVDE